MPQKMTFWEHLAELRTTIIQIVISVLAVSAFCFIFGLRETTLFGYKFYYPYPDIINNISNLVFERIKADLLPKELKLFPVRIMDPVVINVYISLFLGIVISTPKIYYELGVFIGPGLYPKERRALKAVTIPATILFVIGCLFSYFIITPIMIDFMYMYIQSMDTMPIVSIADFVSFVLMMTLAFGIIFELPIFMVGFTKLGLVEADFWKHHWRVAVVLMVVVGAVITPDGTGITQMLVALPMMLLYLIGYLGARRVQARKVKV